MSPQVIVSATMPTYNRAGTLAASIDSVMGQTFPDWELIVVDDGSTDDTATVLRGVVDPRIRVIRLPHNRGRGFARNVAVRHARGRYIAICDSDDRSTPDRFATQVAVLDAHPEIDVLSSRVDWQPGPQLLFPERPDDIARRFTRGEMGVPNGPSMIRASCFARHGLYCEELSAAEDFEFFHRIHRASRFAVVPQVLMQCRYEIPNPGPAWVTNALAHRYALHLAGRRDGGPAPTGTMPFARFARQVRPRLAVYTWDLLRLLHFRWRVRGRTAHRIR